ncbi:MAG: pyridoxamine 5'-phosphate oxidase family protein [Halovenus sp.]
MEILENTLEGQLESVLDRPLFCFFGTVTPECHPRISPLWVLWEDNAVWITADTVEKSDTERVAQRPETALAVVDFDVHTGRVEHVGMRGTAAVTRARRLLRKYLGEEIDEWDPGFVDLDPDRWSSIQFTPDTVVARDQSFSPSLEQ